MIELYHKELYIDAWSDAAVSCCRAFVCLFGPGIGANLAPGSIDMGGSKVGLAKTPFV